jgi:hypothetical protein
VKYFLLFLLPLIALGEGPGMPAAGPKMGPEIEFRGKKQIPSMICQAAPQIGIGLMLTGFAGTVAVAGKSIYEDEPAGNTLLAPVVAGTAAAVGSFVFCTVAAINDAGATDSYLRKIRANLLPRQKAGELTLDWTNDSSRRALVVTYPDGRKILFAKDPNVVEVKTVPVRPGELAADLDFYEKEIFETARAVGLKSPKLDGPWNGGHIHVDIEEAFGGDPRKLKNFILDYIEHPELAGGVLVKDFYNAPAIDPLKQKEAIGQIVEALDHWAEKGEKVDAFKVLELAELGPFGKRDALNVNTVYNTLEIRGLRSQKSAAELLKVMRLIEARIKYTNGLPSKQFRPRPIKMSPEEKRKAFRAYVEEAGLDYEEFKELAPRKFQDNCAGFFSRIGF